MFKSIEEFNSVNNNWDLIFFDGLGYPKDEIEFLMKEIDEKIKKINENNENCFQKFEIKSERESYTIYMIQPDSFILIKNGGMFAVLCMISCGYVKRIPICEDSVEEDLSSFRALTSYPFEYHYFLLYKLMKEAKLNNSISKVYSYQNRSNKGLVKIFETEVIKYKDNNDKDLFIARIHCTVIDTLNRKEDRTNQIYLILRPFSDSHINECIRIEDSQN